MCLRACLVCASNTRVERLNVVRTEREIRGSDGQVLPTPLHPHRGLSESSRERQQERGEKEGGKREKRENRRRDKE